MSKINNMYAFRGADKFVQKCPYMVQLLVLHLVCVYSGSEAQKQDWRANSLAFSLLVSDSQCCMFAVVFVCLLFIHTCIDVVNVCVVMCVGMCA